MKKYISFLTLTALVAGMVLSCKREYPVAAGYTGVSSAAFIKIIHASPNFRAIFHVPDSLNVYTGATKINGPLLKYGGAFPTNGGNGGYLAVDPGNQSIRLTVSTASAPDSTVVSLTKTLVAGAYYTLVITDSIQSMRDSSKIWVQDSYPKPTLGAGYLYLRFVHAVMDDSAGTTVDLYSQRTNLVLFANIKIDSITPFTSFPSIAGGVDTLYVRRSGTTAILAKLNTVTAGDQQFYTALYAGDTALSPAAKTRALSFYRNK